MIGSTRSCEPYSERVGAYALGALDPDEAAEVAAHLRDCARCQRELIEIEDALGLLPIAADRAASTQPPRALRQRVLAAIGRTPQPAAANRRSIDQRIVLALAAVVLLALISTAYMGIALASERAVKDSLAAQLSMDEIVLNVVDSTATEKRVLRAAGPAAPSAYGKLYTRPDSNHAVLMVARMPRPRPGYVYRAWVWRNGVATCPGDLPVNEDGFGRMVFPIDPNDALSIERVMVSAEPASALVQGTAEPVVSWQR